MVLTSVSENKERMNSTTRTCTLTSPGSLVSDTSRYQHKRWSHYLHALMRWQEYLPNRTKATFAHEENVWADSDYRVGLSGIHKFSMISIVEHRRGVLDMILSMVDSLIGLLWVTVPYALNKHHLHLWCCCSHHTTWYPPWFCSLQVFFIP